MKIVTRLIIAAVILLGVAFLVWINLQPQNVHDEGVPYRVDASAEAQYHVDCRYPGYKVQGEFVNTTAFDQKGPTSGVLPTDRPRCTLRKTAGPGPVTLTITKNGKASSAVVNEPGQESKVYVL